MAATQDIAELEGLEEETWSALDRLARALYLDTVDLQMTLDAIVSLAVETIGVARYAGLIRVVHRQLVPQAAVGEPPLILDVLQQELGTGPCVDAALTQCIVRIEDTASEDRWPALTERAAQLGVASMLCVPLWINETTLGTLSLYAEVPAAFTQHHVQLTRLYATHAALALADAQRTANLHTALVNRDLIGRAKGILIERHRLTSDAAFRTLSAASQACNTKLTVVAQHLVDSGELLGPDTSR